MNKIPMEVILKTFQIPNRSIVYNTKKRLLKRELLIIKGQDTRGRPKKFNEESMSALKKIVENFPKDEIFTAQKARNQLESEQNRKFSYNTVYFNLMKIIKYERKKDVAGLRRNLGPVIEYRFVVCNKL